MPTPAYAELHCLSNFTFLRGASHPEELVERAAELGYAALALTDECSLAGVVRAHVAAGECGLRLIIGSELRLADGPTVVALAATAEGYARLSRLITRARRRTPKGEYHLTRADLEDGLPGCLLLWVPGQTPDEEHGRWLAAHFAGCVWIAAELHCDNDDHRLALLTALGTRLGLPMVAAGDVHMHVRARKPLQDLVTAIRLKTTVDHCGHALQPNGERHLRPLVRLAGIYPSALLEESLRIAERCTFTLEELRYRYPSELVPEGETPTSHLRHLAEAGAQRRFPQGVPARVRALIEHELSLIAELKYEPFFLSVHDIVAFARTRGILCQGRGSAANSAVCYCLGITEVDPSRMEMLFERFISKERNEPPDIDVDFEHERREEIIQYIYGKYGRERAALAATVITYRPRSAIRDAGKALGLDLEQVERIAKNHAWWDGREVQRERLREEGFDPDSPKLALLLKRVDELICMPRHLSQHVGGFVIADGALSELVPIENAAMPERTVIQWDKDDLDALGLLKVDVLALGMLSAIRRCLALVSDWRGENMALADVPAEDPATYAMICKADTVGVFQIESRAQMTMLPRLKPRRFYDLVVEVAIIRPGPIQGDMVHPFLARREGREPITYPSKEVKSVLERTLGVPIFQEQVIKLAMVAAGFSAGEADQLRRAIGSWRKRDHLARFRERLLDGMQRRGYAPAFADQIWRQIEGFGEYGFPESHAASFALLAYASAWLKCHEPAAFLCALLNSWPMGFYAPAQLIQDGRRHGLEVRPVDVTVSDWECTLEAPTAAIHKHARPQPAVRIGLRYVKGLSRTAGERIESARNERAFTDLRDFALRTALDRGDMEALAAAAALTSLAGHRHAARWQVLGIDTPPPLFAQDMPPATVSTPPLPVPGPGDDVIADYASLGFSLGQHPLAFLRPRLRRLATAERIHTLPDGARVHTAGLVTIRQRPGSAQGVIFITMEDETGVVNVIVWPSLIEKQRRIVVGARLLGVQGKVQREGEVIHVVANRLIDYTALLGELSTHSRDFH
jgi:error-prone DNA polymerase